MPGSEVGELILESRQMLMFSWVLWNRLLYSFLKKTKNEVNEPWFYYIQSHTQEKKKRYIWIVSKCSVVWKAHPLLHWESVVNILKRENSPRLWDWCSGWFHINSVFFPRNRKHDTGILANSSLASNCSHWSSGIWMEILWKLYLNPSKTPKIHRRKAWGNEIRVHILCNLQKLCRK